MSNSHFINFQNSLLIYMTVVLGVLLSLSTSSPLYDVYSVENEPPAIPMHFLKIPIQSNNNIPSSDVDNIENEIVGSVFKRQQAINSDSCCPTTIDIIEPSHGKNRSGELVELYQSEAVRQRFYETSCNSAVADQPCRYLDRKHSGRSRCVQQYSHTYAMVRDMASSNAEWKLDYIQVRSGCSCHITNA